MAGGDIGFVTEYRVDVLLAALVVELHGSEEIAVVGQGQRVHPVGLDLGDQVRDAVGAVEQTVVRVAVQVRERG